MTTWGNQPPSKGRLWRCGKCCDPLVFVPHRRIRLAPQDMAEIQRRRDQHMQASQDCRWTQPSICEAVGCNCEKPSAVWRDDGIYCALCNGQVEWAACLPPAAIWRGRIVPVGRPCSVGAEGCLGACMTECMRCAYPACTACSALVSSYQWHGQKRICSRCSHTASPCWAASALS